MATLYPGKLLLLMAIIGGCLCLLASFSIAEMNIKSSSSGVSKKKHEHFMPLVAFQCGFRNKYMNADGRWQDDPSSAAGCLHGKYDILKYCKRVYPNEQITNIVEYSHLTRIDHWCREDGTDCHHHQFTMRPFRCISGEFITESLQVPQRCHFSHIAGKDKCNDYKFWNVRAEEECGQKKEEGTNQPMRLRSFAILEPCGLGMFRGVEFVCCPKELEERIEKVVDLEAEDGKKTPTTPSDDDEDEDDDDDEDEYSEEDEDEEEGKSSSSKKETAKEEGTGAEQQDKYFKDDPSANEHERFREAEERLEKKHRKKVTKVITEWSELFERYNKMKEKDPKGAEQYKREMTAKFRKTVASLEAENHEQRKQIEELHDERVQTALNEKKRQATHEYRAALAVQVGQTNKQNVLRTLKNYIRAEEKDRQHMLNRYRHLLRSDPEAAVSFEPILLHRLRYIDLRINGTLAMLRDFPELEKEIRPVAIGFWKAYRKENTPEALDEEAEGSKKTISTGGHYLSDEERNAQLIRLYKQNFERKHPAAHLAMQLQESAKQQHGSETTKTTTTTATRKMVALKDVLKEDASSVEASKKLQKMAQSSSSEKELEEDSDEDQFEEDEDGEKTTLMSVPSSTKTPVKIHVELLNGAEATKTMKKGSKKGDDEKPAKLMTSKATSSESEEDDDDEEDEDEDEDMTGTGGGSEAESEYSASNDKKAPAEGAKRKHMRIDVEPIMLAPSPDELNGGDGPIAYAKHHRSFTAHKTQDDYSSNMDSSIIGRWLAQANLLLGLIALTFAALAIIILLRRRRNRHPGFIEVDVCTPEESHVQGMQVNGYENPTYTFFEGKQQC